MAITTRSPLLLQTGVLVTAAAVLIGLVSLGGVGVDGQQWNWGWPTWQAQGDHYTTGSILQPQGGSVYRADGRNDYYSTWNAWNSPSNSAANRGFGFFGR